MLQPVVSLHSTGYVPTTSASINIRQRYLEVCISLGQWPGPSDLCCVKVFEGIYVCVCMLRELY